MGCIGGLNLPYYTKEKILTKDHIFSQFVDDEELGKYIPTGVKSSSLSRELLLSILAYIRKDKYLSLYGLYKASKLQRSTVGYKNYDIKIGNDFAEKIREFISVNR